MPAEWEEGGESQTAHSGGPTGSGWRQGSKKSLDEYLAAVDRYGIGSTQEKNAANRAMIGGGWGPKALGERLGGHSTSRPSEGERRGRERRGNGGGDRGSGGGPRSGIENGENPGPKSPPVDR